MKSIGFIGKAQVNRAEQKDLEAIGRLIALHGNPVVMVNGGNAVKAVTRGVESIEGGMIKLVTTGVIELANHTFVYADDNLYRRLLDAYPEIQTQDNVSLIFGEKELKNWLAAIDQVYEESKTT